MFEVFPWEWPAIQHGADSPSSRAHPLVEWSYQPPSGQPLLGPVRYSFLALWRASRGLGVHGLGRSKWGAQKLGWVSDPRGSLVRAKTAEWAASLASAARRHSVSA